VKTKNCEWQWQWDFKWNDANFRSLSLSLSSYHFLRNSDLHLPAVEHLLDSSRKVERREELYEAAAAAKFCQGSGIRWSGEKLSNYNSSTESIKESLNLKQSKSEINDCRTLIWYLPAHY
jgi:hypothetical protein